MSLMQTGGLISVCLEIDWKRESMHFCQMFHNTTGNLTITLNLHPVAPWNAYLNIRYFSIYVSRLRISRIERQKVRHNIKIDIM